MKTRKEVEALKLAWQRDPIWDLENSEDFHEYRLELLEFRQQKEKEWRQKVQQDEIVAAARHQHMVVCVDGIVFNLAHLVTANYHENVPLEKSKDGTYLMVLNPNGSEEKGAWLQLTWDYWDHENQLPDANNLYGPRATDLWAYLQQLAIKL
jgi:hypothetical protein